MPLADVPNQPWIKKFCKDEEEEGNDPMDVDENEKPNAWRTADEGLDNKIITKHVPCTNEYKWFDPLRLLPMDNEARRRWEIFEFRKHVLCVHQFVKGASIVSIHTCPRNDRRWKLSFAKARDCAKGSRGQDPPCERIRVLCLPVPWPPVDPFFVISSHFIYIFNYL